MAQVKQIRFYGYNSPLNYPSGITYNELVNGQAFLNSEEKAQKVGIQAPPGTKFLIGGGLHQGNYIVVGSTGIYEIDLTNMGITIDSIQLYGTSLDQINMNNSSSLIVDIITNT